MHSIAGGQQEVDVVEIPKATFVSLSMLKPAREVF